MTDTSTLDALRSRALSGVREERNQYRDEALLWRAWYEELRPFIQSTPNSDFLVEEMDKLLSEARSR